MCAGTTDDLVCETCRTRVRTEALERKIAAERPGRRGSPISARVPAELAAQMRSRFRHPRSRQAVAAVNGAAIPGHPIDSGQYHTRTWRVTSQSTVAVTPPVKACPKRICPTGSTM